MSSRPLPPAPISTSSAPGSLQEARAVCNEQYPASIGNYLAHAMCVNDAVDRFALPTAPHPDLVKLQGQIRAALSGKIDQASLSPQAGERKMKEADALIEQIEHDREAGNDEAADRRLTRLQAMAE
jgi:hypothetical protein